MQNLSLDQVSILRKTPHIADILDENGVVKSVEESQILEGHFGIVPGVITEEIARILEGFYSCSPLKTTFGNALKPNNNLGFSGGKMEVELYIPGEKKLDIISTSIASGHSLNAFSLSDYTPNNLDRPLLDRHLMQSGAFRLADGATEIDPEGYFAGHYNIPKDHPFLTEEGLPFSFMKEVANQVISLSSSLRNNPDGIHSGSTILLASSHIAKDPNQTKIYTSGDSPIVVSGKARIDPENPKRGVIAEYSTYVDSVPLFHGKITGTKVPTKMLFRK